MVDLGTNGSRFAIRNMRDRIKSMDKVAMPKEEKPKGLLQRSSMGRPEERKIDTFTEDLIKSIQRQMSDTNDE
jgi:hypothetical protein